MFLPLHKKTSSERLTSRFETRRQASHASVEQASMLALGPGTSIRDEFELEVPDVFFADGGWGCEKTAGSTTGVV